MQDQSQKRKQDCFTNKKTIQAVWGGFGSVYSADWKGKSVVVKEYQWESKARFSDPIKEAGLDRKRTSYHNEIKFYQSQWRPLFEAPQLLDYIEKENTIVLVLENINLQGNAQKNLNNLDLAIQLMAKMHARSLGASWEMEGNYWRLKTRTLEASRIQDPWFKENAQALDQAIYETQFPCLIHGDSKPSNYIFNSNKNTLQAVDFQYFGTGIGVMDLVCYCTGLIPEGNEAEFHEITEAYFGYLDSEINKAGVEVDFPALYADWISKIPLVWTDYTRFLMGWGRGSVKLGRLSKAMTKLAEELLAK